MKMSSADRLVAMAAVLVAAVLLTLDISCHGAGVEPAEDETAAITPAGCDPEAKPAELNLTLKDMNGADVSLAASKGKVLIINFWATWCAPCKAEIPGFVELQKKYENDLQVFGISIDDTPDMLKPYAEEFKMNYPVLVGLHRDDVEKAYGPFFGIPQSFMISRDGKVCSRHAGIRSKDRFEQEIKALL